jgi:hypothetical protein
LSPCATFSTRRCVRRRRRSGKNSDIVSKAPNAYGAESGLPPPATGPACRARRSEEARSAAGHRSAPSATHRGSCRPDEEFAGESRNRSDAARAAAMQTDQADGASSRTRALPGRSDALRAPSSGGSEVFELGTARPAPISAARGSGRPDDAAGELRTIGVGSAADAHPLILTTGRPAPGHDGSHADEAKPEDDDRGDGRSPGRGPDASRQPRRSGPDARHPALPPLHDTPRRASRRNLWRVTRRPRPPRFRRRHGPGRRTRAGVRLSWQSVC